MSETPSTELQSFSRVMKRDWDDRASENAKWYINTVRVQQSEAEFDETGRAEVEKLLHAELEFLTQGRDPRALRVLEIGCGIGRMTKHLAEVFGEIHAVDVSGEMIRQARERLQAFPNVHCHETSGCDFAALPSEHFDLVFSAYVFQHVPSAAVIRSNLVDAFRVLKPGGLCKFQVNSTAAETFRLQEHDTWTGAAFPESALRELARELDAQLLRLFDAGTQYCWVTWRKRPVPEPASPSAPLRIADVGRRDDLRIKQVPVSGDQAYLALLVSGLTAAADANAVSVALAGRTLLPCYVGPVAGVWETAGSGGLLQIEVPLTAELPLGATEVRVQLNGGEPSEPVPLFLCEPEPKTPEIVTVRNASDYGTDVQTSGPKAWVMLYVKYLPETASTKNVWLQVGNG
jgi:ubiquinone/menaquinone biosynthesis C-methylase UbiE